MTSDAVVYVMAVAVVLVAAAMVAQTIVLAGLYRTSKAAGERIAVVASQAESLFQSAQRTLEQSRKQLTDISTRSTEVLELARTQLVRIDQVLGEATSRAKIQMDRVEMVLDDTVSRLHETAAIIHNGVLRPVKEISGIAIGIRAFVDALFRGRRLTVEQATHDEEMFI
jgi:hypothetical protein